MRAKDILGVHGEQVAARYLTETTGYVLLDRNWRCDLGELDLVLRDADTLVFCEVKTRSTAVFGDPSEAVRPEKMRRIGRLAARWLSEHPGRWPNIRFDVVSVVCPPASEPSVTHIRAAW